MSLSRQGQVTGRLQNRVVYKSDLNRDTTPCGLLVAKHWNNTCTSKKYNKTQCHPLRTHCKELMIMVKKLVLLGLALMLSLGINAATVLVSADDPVFGPDSLTIDTNTNLAWLDLVHTDPSGSVSTDYNYDYVSSRFGPGEEFEGFRYATQEEVMTLFEDAGIPDVPGTSTANVGPITSLQALIGTTDSEEILRRDLPEPRTLLIPLSQ